MIALQETVFVVTEHMWYYANHKIKKKIVKYLFHNDI